ncbi:MAG TPA: MBL fold metallo-hydrolase [Planktothrix sp.]|jgi:glyoxylase-like metal-dependent hydrolase (beta-lactamase superfamily II)
MPEISSAHNHEHNERDSIFRTRLGAHELIVLSDGFANFNPDDVMIAGDETKKSLPTNSCCPVDVPINVFLLVMGQEIVLVDTGGGEIFKFDTAGRLLKSFNKSGYAPEQITTILITHFHGDHTGGLTVGGKRLFPNAKVFADMRESRHWLTPIGEDAYFQHRTQSFRDAHTTVDPYVESGQLHEFDAANDDSDRILPGVRTRPLYGHTPGHCGYMIESQGERILFWGDSVHFPDIQLFDPTISVTWDVDQEMAKETRVKLFQDAASERFLIGAPHIGFPGLGYVDLEGNRYKWTAIEKD